MYITGQNALENLCNLFKVFLALFRFINHSQI